jgi:hypothetical protein
MAAHSGRRFLFAMTIAGLSGCAATLSENQCKANDWYTVGYSDASNGYDASRLLQHDNACVGHGVVPDRAQYTAGWNDGIQAYCTPENGFNVGENGATYNRICPANLESDFHAAYSNGRTLYVAESEVSQLENAIDQRSARIQEMKNEMQYAVNALVAPDTATTDRLFLLERTKSLSEEQGRLQSEIDRLSADLAVKRDRVESLRQTLAYGS